MHGIEQFDDGSASFYAARMPAWHRLGTITNEATTAKEALELAQLDWDVKLAPLYAHDDDVMVRVGGSQAVVRTHRKKGHLEALGVVGMKYVPVQNREAFDLLTAIVAQSDLRFETAGSIFGGTRVFISAKIPDAITVLGHDHVDLYLLATNNHDGKRALRFAVTPVRVVCQNTLALGLRTAKRVFKARHTGVPVERLVDEARKTLGLIKRYTEALTVESERLAATPMEEPEFRGYVARVLDESVLKGRRVKDSTKEMYVQQLLDLWNSPTQESIAATQWAAYNSVVEWLDWVKIVKQPSAPASQRSDPNRPRLSHLDLRALRVINGDSEGDKLFAYDLLASK